MKCDNTKMTTTEHDNTFFPELMTEQELCEFLRISHVSAAKDTKNVIEHLKRYRGLPRLHLCNKTLFPRKAVIDWIEKETTYGK